ncbi:MAG: SPASM domain-containing protein, partial [Deltaproteobacteria bacterium]|nr:SPASM domain-containing protein [Deltaproteobacteria bacterium]
MLNLRPTVDQDDFSIPVDKNGLVIYFSVKGQPFFFNGHTGFFSDSLPAYADEAFQALTRPAREQNNLFKSLKRKYGDACQDLVSEIRSFQNGTHPDLAIEPKQQGFTQRMKPHTFNVYLSQSCNLSCRYCFNQGGTFGNAASTMSVETARDLLAFFSKIVHSGTHEKISVNFFGGEPLLAPRAVYFLARGLQDLNHHNLKTSIHLMLSTNGTIYNKKIFDVFAERPDVCTVVISLDAFKDVHDRNRPFANPKKGSSYDTVLKNLKRMIREKVPNSVTCIVPYPYDFIGASERLHDFGVEYIELKELNHHIYGCKVLPEVFDRDFQLWRENYIAYCDYHIDYLKGEHPVKHVDRFGVFRDYANKLGNHDQAKTTLACSVADSKIGVSAAGKLIPCEAFIEHAQFELGDVKKGFDEAKFTAFEAWLLTHGQHRLDDDQCRNCYAKLICGGGCYAESIDKSGELHPVNGPSCRYIRETVKIDLYYISQMKRHNPEVFSKI